MSGEIPNRFAAGMASKNDALSYVFSDLYNVQSAQQQQQLEALRNASAQENRSMNDKLHEKIYKLQRQLFEERNGYHEKLKELDSQLADRENLVSLIEQSEKEIVELKQELELHKDALDGVARISVPAEEWEAWQQFKKWGPGRTMLAVFKQWRR